MCVYTLEIHRNVSCFNTSQTVGMALACIDFPGSVRSLVPSYKVGWDDS